MKSKIIAMLILAGAVLAACASPANPAVTPTAFGLPSPTFFPVETSVLSTQPPISLTPFATQPSGSTNLCADPGATALIDSLKTAVLNSDGPLLASLVSPASGLDVAYFHSGTVVNYRPDQAKFLFETTYEVDWGVEPGSGAPKTGSFHDVVVPAMVKMFNQPYTLHCNELKYGGATYPVNFPYDKGYYSIYFPGTEANGSLDWQTWVAGIEYVDGRPYLYALMQFFWEP